MQIVQTSVNKVHTLISVMCKKKKKRENDLLQVHMPLCTVDASVAGPGKAVEL